MKTIGTKVTDEVREELNRIAQASGKTTSDLMRMCMESVVYGHYKIEGERVVPTDEYLDALRPVETYSDECDYERLGFREMRDAYAQCNYPDHVVRSNNGMLAAQIRDGGRYNGKRFSDDAC